VIQLSEEQLAAAQALDDRVQVIAGAGSGKSTMLVGRYREMLYRGIQPDTVVIVTFTVKAAKELKVKMADLPPPKYIGTIHGFCTTLLHPGWGVATNEIAEAAKKWAMDAFPKEKWPSNDAIACGATGSSRVYQVYKRRLTDDKLLDFDMLLAHGYDVAYMRGGRNGEELHLIVDEYQDTGPLERSIYNCFKTQFVVGDPRQTLYTFRGVKDWDVEEMEKRDFRTFTLTHSYRFPFWIADRVNQIRFDEPYPPLVAEHRDCKLTYLPWKEWVSANLKRSMTVLCRSNRDVAMVTAEIEGMGLQVSKPKPVPPSLHRYAHWMAAKFFPSNSTVEQWVRMEGGYEQWAAEARKKLCSIKDIYIVGKIPEDLTADPDVRELLASGKPVVEQLSIIQQMREGLPSDGIKVTTVHSYKGLEDDYVCYVVPQHAKGSIEDKRILYVAMTRAKNALNIDWKLNYSVAPTWIPS